MGRIYTLEREQLIPRSRHEVFAFFCDAVNLERITPGELRFQILTPAPIVMRVGTLIDYRLRLHGISFRWRTEITAFEPEVRFVDTQVKGPYRLWEHEHHFDDTPNGTIMRDTVRYALPFWIFGQAAHTLFVKRSIGHIFDYRRDTIARQFCP